MKLVNMTCPNCGAQLQVDADKQQIFCEYCGTKLLVHDDVQHIQYDNAEEAGYRFEKGRQRAMSESGVRGYGNPNYYRQASPAQQLRSPQTLKKKRRTWLWVLGWLFVFPVPLTILLLRKKDMKPAIKYGLIALAWIIYLGMANSDKSSNAAKSSSADPVAVVEEEESGSPSKNQDSKEASVDNQDTEESAEEDTPAAEQGTASPKTESEETGESISTEYENALDKAERYSSYMHMSRQGIYDLLTFEDGDQFPADAAQYAVDHVDADWNANALEKAKIYQKTMNMSDADIYDQLVSEYGDQFTAEEAEYAIDHLE